MCIKPSDCSGTIYHQQASEPIDCQSDRIKSLVTEQTNNKKLSPVSRTMPKRYHPYQVKKEAPRVVCKNVGANGTIFIVKDDSADTKKTVVVNEDTEEIVDVEKCDDDSQVILGSRQSVQNVTHQDVKPEEKEEVVKCGGTGGGSSGKPADDPVSYAAFVTILIHALKCSGLCEKPACRKMTLVLKHYKVCAFKRNTLNSAGGWSSSVKNCKICGQLLKIVSIHSKFMCKMPADQMGCPVLMCDAFRVANASAAAGTTKTSVEQLNKMKMMMAMMRRANEAKEAPELNKLVIQPKLAAVDASPPTTTRIPTMVRRANGMARPVCGGAKY